MRRTLRPTRSTCAACWATPTRRGRGRSCARPASTASRSRRSAGCCRVLSKDAASAAEVAAIRRRLANNVAETAGAAHFAVSYGDGAYLLLHSDRRADAILLEALIADQPQSDLIPKLVAGLLAHRKAGPLGEHAGERLRPARARPLLPGLREDDAGLRGPRLARRALRGRARVPGPHDRAAATSRSRWPTSAKRTGATDLLLAKEGPGRLYYRIGLRYAPDEPRRSTPLDHGFTVERRYEGVDDPKDVTRDADGTWRDPGRAPACACG